MRHSSQKYRATSVELENSISIRYGELSSIDNSHANLKAIDANRSMPIALCGNSHATAEKWTSEAYSARHPWRHGDFEGIHQVSLRNTHLGQDVECGMTLGASQPHRHM